VNDAANTVHASVKVLEIKNEQRIADQLEAQRNGVHFWICGALFRMSGPTEDAILDTENMCGFMGIHCAICGATSNDEPLCPGLG